MSDKRIRIIDMIKIKDVVTLTGTVCGILALMFAIIVRDLPLSFFLMLVGCFTDVADGYVARKLKQANEIGIQIDSLNDFFVFGVVPSILIFIGYVDDLPFELFFFIPGCIIFILGALLRLARFNITTETAKGYTGIVTPLSALMICNTYFTDFFAVRAFGQGNAYSVFYSFFFPILLGIMGYLNITTLVIFSEKAKKKGGKIKYFILFGVVATPVIGLIGLVMEGIYASSSTPVPLIGLYLPIFCIFMFFMVGEWLWILKGFKNYLDSKKTEEVEATK